MKRLVLLVVLALVVSLCVSSAVVAENSYLSTQRVGGAGSKAAIITVVVTDDEGTPIKGATVILWNHTATPTEQAGISYSDQKGHSSFSVPEFKGMGRELTQHLSVTASYPGATTAIVNWSVGQIRIIDDKGVADTEINASEDMLVNAKLTRKNLQPIIY